MKMKMAVAAVLALTSVGFIAPPVEAGRRSVSCTYTYDVGTGALSVNGSFSGIRFTTIVQGRTSLTVNYTDYTSVVRGGGTWTQTGRSSGTYAFSDTVPAFAVESVDWYFYNARYALIGEAACTLST